MTFPEIDPAIFTLELFGGSFSLRWYAMAYLAGILLGWVAIVQLMKRPALWPANMAPMTTKQPEDLLTYMVLGIVLGGRVGFVLFYNLPYYLEHPLEAFQIWDGGMSFHGGFLGVIAGIILFTRFNKLPLLSVGDSVAAVAPFGLLFGRLANFINGELWGRPTTSSIGMVFPDPRAQICPDWWQDAVCARHPSQLYEAALEGLALILLMAFLIWGRKALKRPGTLIGWFFVGYGLARSFVENFRQGDLQFTSLNNPWGQVIRLGDTADAFGLTMGQILSLPMVVVGIGFLLWARRNAAQQP